MTAAMTSSAHQNEKDSDEEISLRPEDLLHFVLEKPDISTNNEAIYTFLLGSRLFLSPHQLLVEIQRIANSEEQRSYDVTNDDDVDDEGEDKCPVCKRRKPPSVTTTSTRTCEQVTSFCSPLASPTYESETIRRRKRGRMTSQSRGVDPVTSVELASRDSGIVSACFDDNNPTSSSSSQPEADHHGDDHDDVTETVKCSCLRRRLVAVLHEWVRHFPTDFRNKKIMATLCDVIRSCQGDNEDLAESCASVLDCVSRGISAQEHYERELTASRNDVTSRDCVNDDGDGEGDDTVVASSSSRHHVTLTLTRRSRMLLVKRRRRRCDHVIKFVTSQKDATDVNEFAKQLSLIELDFLKHIGAEELMQMFETFDCMDSRTNLGASVNWFNRLSSLVATTVCMCRKRKQARHVIGFYLRVADRCYQLSNFNSAFAIWTGLQKEPVVRLRRVWAKINLSEYNKIKKVFSVDRNFLEYRKIYINRIETYLKQKNCSPERKSSSSVDADNNNRLSMVSVTSHNSVTSQPGDSGVECDPNERPSTAAAVTSSSKSRRRGSCEMTIVPVLVLLKKDVYNLLNHTTPTTSEEGLINWEKLKRLSHILRPIEDWKRGHLAYTRNEQVRNFLLNTRVWKDKDLYLTSYKREPPINKPERSHMKSLKHDEADDCDVTARSKTL